MSESDRVTLDFDPMAFGGRLKMEMEAKEWVVKDLQKALRKLTGVVSGTGYGTLWASSRGQAAGEPPRRVLDAMAGLFGVRPAWLGSHDGERTDEEEQLRLGQMQAASAEAFPFSDFLRAVQEGFQPESTRLENDPVLQVVLIDVLVRLLASGLVAEGQLESDPPEEPSSPFLAIGAAISGGAKWITIPRSVDEDVRVRYVVAVSIGRALRAPFDYLPITPDELSYSELRDHLVRTCQVLTGLADARGRQLADPTERPKREESDNV